MSDQFGNSDADMERGDHEFDRAREDGMLAPNIKCSNGAEHRWLADAGVSGMWWCSHCGKRVEEREPPEQFSLGGSIATFNGEPSSGVNRVTVVSGGNKP